MEILLAEDSPIQGVMIRRLLEQQGCKVTLATNGREALRLAGEKAFDLIFMDCNMPEMDGYEATRQIRAREGSSAALRIVGMSAEESEKTRAGCLAAGMNDCISKLAGPKELQRALEAQIHECPS
ncbi:MAG: response regulator [Verrucomicrobiae bacterium]|nr:response regulator [Verrucomicrobiae bacterium]